MDLPGTTPARAGKKYMLDIRSFRNNNNGTVAMLWGIGFLAVIILIGGAVDFSRHRTEANQIQHALDATVLYAARLPSDVTDIEGKSRSFFDTNTVQNSSLVESFTLVQNGNSIRGEVRGNISTYFLGVIGISQLPVFSDAEVVASNTITEAALVLDVTGSMAGDKISRLRDAATLFLDEFENSASPGTNNRVSLVPFDESVRVTPSDFKASWLDNSGESQIAREIFPQPVNLLDLYDHLGEDWRGCLRTRSGAFAYDDTPPIPSNPDTQFLPLFAYDEPDTSDFENSYLEDSLGSAPALSQLSDTSKYGIAPGDEGNRLAWTAAFAGNQSGLGFGPNSRCAATPIIPLTDDYDALRTAVSGLTANGDTNLPEAIAWGHRVLSHDAPFREGLPLAANPGGKAIIFLTDGNNSVDGLNNELRSPLLAQGYANVGEFETLLPNDPSQNDINAYLDVQLAQTCARIKNDGIKIIVIRLELDDQNSADLLRNCASSDDDYYDVPDSAELNGVLGAIGRGLLELHITS